MIDFQSPIAGQLKSLKVKSGQCVKKNELLATVEPLELRQQLLLARQKLAQLQSQAENTSLLSSQRMQLEKSAIAATRTSLQKRLEDTQSLTPLLKGKGLDAIEKQRISLQQRLKEAQTFGPTLQQKGLTAIAQQRISLLERLKNAQALIPVLRQKVENRHELAANGAIATETVLEAEKEYKQSLENIAELQAQLKQLDLTDTQTQQSYQQNVNGISEMQAKLQELEVESTKTEREYLENLRSIGDIQAQLQELDTKAKRLEQEQLETATQRKKEMQEVNREIAKLEQQVNENSNIFSPQDGCVLELIATLGQVVQPGSRLGRLRVTSSSESVIGMAYFPIKDGKQVQSGMAVLITPDTVQRERFGGIIGKITSVSSLPVTKEGMISAIGNPEVVTNLIGETGAVIQMSAELAADPSTASGYKWSSSKGPNLKITSGTTATVRVTVEKRAPITFVLPILREVTGIK